MLYIALLLGLLGSFHCVGMCGPISLILPVQNLKPVQRIIKILLYHTGRILAYGSIGLLFGLLGKGLFLSGFQQRLSILIGVIMIISILLPSKIFINQNITQPLYVMINKIKISMCKQLKKRNNKTLFTIGFLNGFLPCGMIYIALVGAIATESLTKGFLYMVLYGMAPFL